MDCSDLFDQLVFAPDYTSKSHPTGIAPESNDRIDSFRKAVDFWLMQYAGTLANDVNAGYALLAVLNSYPDFIAQLKGFVPSTESKNYLKERYIFGILDVFPHLNTIEKRQEVLDALYADLRCTLAHALLTGQKIVLASHIPESIMTCSYDKTMLVVVNPQLWFQQVYTHFNAYISALDTDEELQHKLFARLKQPL
jgi:hypothetical protein